MQGRYHTNQAESKHAVQERQIIFLHLYIVQLLGYLRFLKHSSPSAVGCDIIVHAYSAMLGAESWSQHTGAAIFLFKGNPNDTDEEKPKEKAKEN
jgi:hypothetical protein